MNQNESCDKMGKKDKFTIDEEFVEGKISKINNLLEGLRVPEIMAILGGVTMHFVDNIHEQTHCFGGCACDWLDHLQEQILENFPDDEDVLEEVEERLEAN